MSAELKHRGVAVAEERWRKRGGKEREEEREGDTVMARGEREGGAEQRGRGVRQRKGREG